jgi:hypothetical protein
MLPGGAAMAHSRSTTVFAASLLLFFAVTAKCAQNDNKPSEPASSLGVSLSMPDGHFIAFPIQHGNTEEQMTPIPIPGYKDLFGIKMYPYMAGDKVAVRILALVPKKQQSTSSDQIDPAKVPHEHRLVGDYILGKVGDTLQVAEFARFGLPVLTAKVVLAPFAADSPNDPCCCTDNGLVCCGRTFAIMCATCPCPTCGNLKPRLSKTNGDTPSKNESVTEPKPAYRTKN